MHASKKYMIMEWKFGNKGVIDIYKISFELLTSVNVYGTSQLTPWTKANIYKRVFPIPLET